MVIGEMRRLKVHVYEIRFLPIILCSDSYQFIDYPIYADLQAGGRSITEDSFIDRIARPTLGILLAVSAGALVYVGASHLLPEVEKENRRFSIITLVAGVLVAVAIVMSKQ